MPSSSTVPQPGGAGRNNASHGGTPLKSLDGQALRAGLAGATAWLERQAAAINALNVFPVPDGDTGTNMSMTMRATIDAAAAIPEHHVGQMAGIMARGALMGARGNSGVILSQIVRGFALAVAEFPTLDGAGFAAGLAGATRTAYAGVTKPVEGTILTVIRLAADAATQAAEAGGDLEAVLAASLFAARAAVLDTPNQLPILRQAGVVDAGGEGFALLLEGMLRTLHGEPIPVSDEQGVAVATDIFDGEPAYGYCTEFLIQGIGLNLDSLRASLTALGDSLMVVGDPALVRVHIHTFDPGAALSLGARLGVLRQIKIDNMQLQHETWKEERTVTPAAGISVIAVASGDGFARLFRSLGATEVIAGGQTMNPSAQDLVSAIERAPTTDVIVLPNNENILLTAQQAASLSTRRVGIVPTRTLTQGVSAALALRFDADFDANLAAMQAAAEASDTGEVTVAIRDATFDGLTIAAGQAIGLRNGRIEAVGDTVDDVFWSLLARMQPDSAELLTLYTGEDVTLDAAEAIAAEVRRRYPQAEVEVAEGGQPFYHYIIARE